MEDATDPAQQIRSIRLRLDQQGMEDLEEERRRFSERVREIEEKAMARGEPTRQYLIGTLIQRPRPGNEGAE